MMNKSKGFTIIELLVVIAIIAVLAAIVLVNVTSYIAKGKDAAIKGNLATILTNAAVFYDQNASTYVGFAATGAYINPLAAITAASSPSQQERETTSAFCACATLNSVTGTSTAANHDAYCVDSTGNKKFYNNAITCAVDCPAAGACI